MNLTYKNLSIRPATPADAPQLAAWWNDGAVMAHAGFPNGLGTSPEKVAEKLDGSILIIEDSRAPIGEMGIRKLADDTAEIGVKICETSYQNGGRGKLLLSMLIKYLFDNGCRKVVLDTNLNNLRAQHVYEALGFRKVRVNIDSWRDQLGKAQSSVDYELAPENFIDFCRREA